MSYPARPFNNNLLKDDVVFDVVRQRRGVVAMTPRQPEKAVTVAVIFDGTDTFRYIHVGQLRFWPPGEKQYENVPPIDGELPVGGQAIALKPRPVFAVSALDAALERREQIKREMSHLEEEFRRLRVEDERLIKAIEVLKG